MINKNIVQARLNFESVCSLAGLIAAYADQTTNTAATMTVVMMAKVIRTMTKGNCRILERRKDGKNKSNEMKQWK